VHRRLEGRRHLCGDRDAAARQTKNDDVRTTRVLAQALRQPPPSFDAIAKAHRPVSNKPPIASRGKGCAGRSTNVDAEIRKKPDQRRFRRNSITIGRIETNTIPNVTAEKCALTNGTLPHSTPAPRQSTTHAAAPRRLENT